MIVYVFSGLTSRCVVLAHAYYLVKKYGYMKLTIIWLREPACDISYWDVFDKSQFSDIKINVIEINRYQKSLLMLFRKSIKMVGEEVWSRIKEYFLKCIENKKKKQGVFVDFLPPIEVGWNGRAYDEYNAECWGKVKKTLERKDRIFIKAYCSIVYGEERDKIELSVVKFHLKYKKKVSELLGDGRKYIGVHIRRTDHEVAIRNSGLDSFLEAMRNEILQDAEIRFFLATDDENVEKSILEEFKGKVLVQNNKVWGRDSKMGMESSIIDCLCLSSCSKILGSYTSVFSSFSAKYGKIELIVCKDKEGTDK